MKKLTVIFTIATCLTGCMSPIGSEPERTECPYHANNTKNAYNTLNLGTNNEI